MELVVKPIKATPQLMASLEEKGIISRICPGHDPLETPQGKARCETVYATDEKYGPHKLICVTINTTEPKNFFYHSDKEDFMLIDKAGTTALILTMSLWHKDVLLEKIAAGTLCEEDFVSVICVPNDPELSFFTMNPYFPHVETCSFSSDNPPSFYVGEPRDLDENPIDFKNYRLVVGHL